MLHVSWTGDGAGQPGPTPPSSAAPPSTLKHTCCCSDTTRPEHALHSFAGALLQRSQVSYLQAGARAGQGEETWERAGGAPGGRLPGAQLPEFNHSQAARAGQGRKACERAGGAPGGLRRGAPGGRVPGAQPPVRAGAAGAAGPPRRPVAAGRGHLRDALHVRRLAAGVPISVHRTAHRAALRDRCICPCMALASCSAALRLGPAP